MEYWRRRQGRDENRTRLVRSLVSQARLLAHSPFDRANIGDRAYLTLLETAFLGPCLPWHHPLVQVTMV
jgi:hypothetical protein